MQEFLISYFSKQRRDQIYIKQSHFISALLEGNLEKAKNLESQGASLTKPDANGIYPLPAAVYGANPDAVEYIESRLQFESKKQWGKVEIRKAIDNIEKAMPDNLPNKVTHHELSNWYIKNSSKPWMNKYDNKCLFEENRQKWAVSGWSRRRGGHTLWSVRQDDERHNFSLMAPSREVHDVVVLSIREELNKLKDKVEAKAERQRVPAYKF